MMNSPLRYVGGKTRACKILDEILTTHFDMNHITTIISPFFGGGSFEFYLHNKYSYNIIANDKFTPLITFWNASKSSNNALTNNLYTYENVTKNMFHEMRTNIMSESGLQQATHYFIINRCSFSGATLSGGFSQEASKKRFTKSSVDRIATLMLDNFTFFNQDFTEFLDEHNEQNSILFADPPYYLDSSKLYGVKGDLHEQFDHEKLYQILSSKSNWILTYNDCPYIRNLYKDYKIIEATWSYGMNKSKKSSEIVIINVV